MTRPNEEAARRLAKEALSVLGLTTPGPDYARDSDNVAALIEHALDEAGREAVEQLTLPSGHWPSLREALDESISCRRKR